MRGEEADGIDPAVGQVIGVGGRDLAAHQILHGVGACYVLADAHRKLQSRPIPAVFQPSEGLTDIHHIAT